MDLAAGRGPGARRGGLRGFVHAGTTGARTLRSTPRPPCNVSSAAHARGSTMAAPHHPDHPHHRRRGHHFHRRPPPPPPPPPRPSASAATATTLATGKAPQLPPPHLPPPRRTLNSHRHCPCAPRPLLPLPPPCSPPALPCRDLPLPHPCITVRDPTPHRTARAAIQFCTASFPLLYLPGRPPPPPPSLLLRLCRRCCRRLECEQGDEGK